MDAQVKEYVGDLWWLFVLQGVVTILFGITALFMPGLTLALLVIFFAVYTTIAGVIELVHGFSSIGKSGYWWFSLLAGLVLTGVGIYLIRHPAIALGTFIVLVGALVLARGVFDLMVAAFFSSRVEHRWLWALGVIAGIILWNNPVSGGIAFVWILGLYALIAGAISLAYAFQVRSDYREFEENVNQLIKKPVRN